MRPNKPTPAIHSNELHIEAAATGLTHCRACAKRIGDGEARVAFYRRCNSTLFFHLYCYRPITTVRLYPTGSIKGTEIQEEAKEWIADWNKQFDFNPATLQQYAIKRVKTKAPANRRVLLESFKYLDLATIVSVVTGICKAWHHVSWEDELWRGLTYQQFPNVSIELPSRKSFLETWLCSCAHCSKQLANSERHMVCPLTHRPKCSNCYANEKHRPLSVNWVRYNYNVTPQLIKQSSTPVFEFDENNCIYLYQALPKIVKLRKALLNDILKRENEEFDALFSKKWVDVLKTADEEDFESEKRINKKWKNVNLNNAQESLLDFIMSGKSMKSFDKFMKKVRLG